MPLVTLTEETEVIVNGNRFVLEAGEQEVEQFIADALPQVEQKESEPEPTPAVEPDQQPQPFPHVTTAAENGTSDLPVAKFESKASTAPKGVRNVKSNLS